VFIGDPAPYGLFLAACAAGVGVSLAGELRVSAPLMAAGKLVSASAYLAAALSLGALGSPYGRVLVSGMACCWLGDQMLVARTSQRWFLGGLAAFLAGHLVYVAAFVVRGVSATATLAAAVPMLLLALLVTRWLKPHLETRMVLPVHLYIGAITAMVVVAAGTAYELGGSVLLAGAVLFFVSDLGVARNRFVAPGFVNRAWGLPAYFTAQMLLAASVSS
jgi:uncharacterized membrane protein YhhN